MFKKIKNFFLELYAEEILLSNNICPTHHTEFVFDRWIGTYCNSCLMEKHDKGKAKDAEKEYLRQKSIDRAKKILESLKEDNYECR